MDYVTHMLVMVLVYVILGLSLNLLMGYTGLMSVAHAAFYGLGAYVSALLMINLGANFFVAMIAGMVFAGITGAIISLPALRVNADYLILLTLGFQQVIYGFIFNLRDVTKGFTGLSGIPRPAFFGWQLISPASYLPLAIGLSVLSFVIIWRFTRSPFGRVLKAMREDEAVAMSFGKNVLRFKVLVFAVSGGIAAMAGSLFAAYAAFISPQSFVADVSIFIIALVALGGTANLWGSVLGSLLIMTIPEILTFALGSGVQIGVGRVTGYELVAPLRAGIYGVLLVLFMVFRPQGIIPEYARFGRRKARAYPKLSPEEQIKLLWPEPDPVSASDSGNGHRPTIEIKGVSKAFGGLKAVDGLTLSLPERRITGLIGPNGAGKTTMFNLVTGFLKADEGAVSYQGQDITKRAPHDVVRLGIARSFQGARVLNRMTVIDNVLVARPNQSGEHMLKLFFRPGQVAREEWANIRFAMACLGFVGLDDKADELAGDLSFAEQKMLQLACLLATESKVILLDEPVSGVDPMWIDHVLGLVRQLVKQGKTVCFIEHNLDVVKALADFGYFLGQGKVLAKGTPLELMADRQLIDIYFGA